MKIYVPIRVKGLLSLLIDRKALNIVLTLLFVTVLSFVISVGMGDMKINPVDVIYVFLGKGEPMHTMVVTMFRLPRVIIAMLAGMCLAVAGAILQGIIRNPLASPDIIGIAGGAGVAVITFLTLFSDSNNSLTVSIHWLPLAAFIGATLVAILVYILAWKKGVSPIRLVLIGIGISSLAQALTTLMMILGPVYRASQANIWLTGSVYGSTWSNVQILFPLTFILCSLTLVLARTLNVMAMGDEVATGLGSNVQRDRLILLLMSTALTGGAVAFAGAISFVGLMAPHIARRIVGSASGALIPVSALIGAILVLVADLIGRTAFSPHEIPAGVFTAIVGAPYFIYLLFKNRNL